MEWMKPMEPMRPMSPMKPMASIDLDVPDDWGQPASTGAQNSMRYAYFPHPRRLIVEQDRKRTVYDTAEHSIEGVSQDQSDTRSGKVVFTSQHGPVAMDSLQIVNE